MVNLFEFRIKGADNFKAFSASLHFLKIVGKDLQIEVSKENLVLRALNDAKTAYSSVEFAAGFFERGSFHLHEQAMRQAFGTAGTQGTELDSFSCKLSSKHLCSITKNFRNTNVLALRAENTNENGYELVLELQSSNGIKRTHRFKYADCDVISAVFDDSSACNLSSMCKVFANLLEHMQHAPEVLVRATPNSFQVRSYHRATPAVLTDANRHLETDLSIDLKDFDFYRFGVLDVHAPRTEEGGAAESNVDEQVREVIVSRREWRALLTFSENIGSDDISVLFVNHGKPIKMTAQRDFVSATLIMTTMETQAARISASEAQMAAQASQQPSQTKVRVSSAKAAAGSQRRNPTQHDGDEQLSRPSSGTESGTKSSSVVAAERAYTRNRTAPSVQPVSAAREVIRARSEGTSPSDTTERNPASKALSRKRVILEEEEEEEEDTEEEKEAEMEEEIPPLQQGLRRLSRTGDTVKTLLSMRTGSDAAVANVSGDASQTQTLSSSAGSQEHSMRKSAIQSNGSARKVRSLYQPDDSD